MMVTRALRFYVSVIVGLGTVGFLGNLLGDWLMFRSMFWPGDALSTWVLAIVITTIFIFSLCLPMQLLVRRSVPLALLLGALSGPLFTWLLLFLRHEPLSVRNYLSASGVISLHLVFGTIGLLFAALHLARGPNYALKRTCAE